MDRQHPTRRRYLRRVGPGLAAAAGVSLTGCSGPEEDGDDSGDDDGAY